MKIVCDACQAKYSISDDKVVGKAFKIRCKKCSAIIVVRGEANTAAPEPAPRETDTRVYDYGHDAASSAPADDDAVWHVVIDQDQIGPLTAAAIEQRVASGAINAETFTWREGMADWLPLAEVDTLAALLATASATPASGDSTAVSAMFGDVAASAGQADRDDVFAAASKPRTRVPDDGGELFAASASGEGQATAASKLRGERNESSVLFSLNNLSQLADTSRRAAPAAATAGGQAAGAATGEGSGLIDIRSMASAYMGGGGGGAAIARPASTVGSIDDLPVFGGGGFVESAVIVPMARNAPNTRVLYMMIAAIALLAVIAIALVVLLVGDKPAAQATAAKEEPTAVAQAPATTPAEEPPVVTPPPAPAPAVAPAEAAPAERDKPAVKNDRKKPARVEAQNTGRAAAPRPAAAQPTTTAAAGCDEVACVINGYEGACCAKFKQARSKPAAATRPDAPAALDKQMISAGIANVKARVMTCGDRSPAKGKVTVKVAVAGSGSVKSVTLEGTPDAALGACVVAAVRKASFAATQRGGSFRVPYTF